MAGDGWMGFTALFPAIGHDWPQVRAAASWNSEILALLPADFPAFALETGWKRGREGLWNVWNAIDPLESLECF